MKKTVLGSLVAFGLIGCGPIEQDEETQQGNATEGVTIDGPALAVGTVDLFNYIAPGCAGAGPQYTTQVGGRRWFIPKGYDGSGRKQFQYVKSWNGADYEHFTADGSWIRLWKDTSWAYFDPSINSYCDEQCGAGGQPTTCKHQWANDYVPGGYAYQNPKDMGDWGGQKILPRYFNTDFGLQYFPSSTGAFSILVDAQSENTCGDCASWHEGQGPQRYTIQHLASVTAPNGTVYSNVIKKVVVYGLGQNEVYYYAYGRGWVGYEVQGSTYKDWVTGTTSGTGTPYTCTSGGASSIC